MAETNPVLPPDSLLVRRARNALGLSPEKIVGRMGAAKISSRYWRQIEDGQKNAPDDTYAHMAKAAGLTPERLEEVGRLEAAAILREIEAQQTNGLRRADEYLDEKAAILNEIDDLLKRATPRQSRAALAVLKELVNEGGDAGAA